MKSDWLNLHFKGTMICDTSVLVLPVIFGPYLRDTGLKGRALLPILREWQSKPGLGSACTPGTRLCGVRVREAKPGQPLHRAGTG